MAISLRTLKNPFGSVAWDISSPAKEAIDNNGEIVGSYLDSASNTHGFVKVGASYSRVNDRLYPDTTYATGVNDSGEVVGYFRTGSDGSIPFEEGFTDINGKYTTINDPLGDDGTEPHGYGTRPYGINDSGEIIGTYLDHTATSNGFLDIDGTYTTIDDPLGTYMNFVNGINNNGELVGTYSTAPNDSNGFVYSNGVYATIDDPLGIHTHARGINDQGDVVGYYRDSNHIAHGFVEINGLYRTIDDPRGTEGTFIFGINATDHIVGTYLTKTGSHFFVGHI